MATSWTCPKATPQPLNDTFFDAPMPPSTNKNSVLVHNKACIFALDQHLLSLFASEKRNLFRKFDKS